MPVNNSSTAEDVVVKNVVGAGELGREVDLRALGTDLEDAHVSIGARDYNPEALYIRRVRDGPVVMAYPSGKYVLTGLPSVGKVHSFRDWFIGELNDLDFTIFADTFEIVNVVAVGDMRRGLDLERLVVELGLSQTEYEPEQHPAMNYCPKRHEVLFRIFSSGKIVVQGATSPAEARNAFDWLLSHLE